MSSVIVVIKIEKKYYKYVKLTAMANPIDNEEYLPDPPVLRRTHKAYCPMCNLRSETNNRENRLTECKDCIQCIINMQSIRRASSTRRKYNRIKRKEMVTYWLMTNKINGKFLSRRVMEFL